MSVLGTGVAAGVSQTGLQAQQVAREVDRKKAQDEESARRVRERFEAHLRTLEDPEQVERVDRVRVDEHSFQDQSSQNQADSKQSHQGGSVEQSDVSERHPSSADPSPSSSLYHHLDVKG